MKRIACVAAAALAVVLAGGSAVAQDLTGTWVGYESYGAMSGTGDHGISEGETSYVSGASQWTLTIEEMEGGGIHGTNCSPAHCENVVGVVRANGTEIYLADEDGLILAELIGEQMELCYLEHGEDFQIAVCQMMQRQ